MTMPPLDSGIAAALVDAPRTPPYLDAANLADARRQRLALLDDLPLSDAVEREDLHVPGPEGAPDVVIRTYRPANLSKPAPCLFCVHGGGYVLGHRSMYDLRMDEWCPELGLVGVSVEYRLAPETTFPGPLEDCYAALEWIFDNADSIGVDPARIGVSGASAGGGLAAALALLARDRKKLRPAFQMLAYPMIDDRQTTVSSRWQVPIWPPASNSFGWQSYLGGLYGSDDIPCYAAPTRADDLGGLPPTLIYVGTLDGFCDEDMSYASRLYQAGVPTELHLYPGAPHAFDSFTPGATLARRCSRDVKEWLATATGGTA